MSAIPQLPEEFLNSLSSLKRARTRPEVVLEEIPAPARLAPFAVAMGAHIPLSAMHGRATESDHDDDDLEHLATGRFILLHDPAGSPLWGGQFRIVTFIRAQVDPEMASDELLASVAWDWLSEALDEHGAGYRNAGGTATRVLSESFGTLSDRPNTIDIELRASWTCETSEVRPHLEAWCDMVCTFAGLPPLPEGVSALPNRRLN